MVSIHRVSVIAYLIIRVIYFTFRFKREIYLLQDIHRPTPDGFAAVVVASPIPTNNTFPSFIFSKFFL